VKTAAVKKAIENEDKNENAISAPARDGTEISEL
jgi:hypothetical protein